MLSVVAVVGVAENIVVVGCCWLLFLVVLFKIIVFVVGLVMLKIIVVVVGWCC